MTIRLYMDYRGSLIHPPEALEPFLPWNFRIAALRNSHLFIAVTELINRAAGITSFTDRLKRERVPMEEAWRRFDVAVESIDRWCTANGAELFFMLIPPDPSRENNEPVHRRMAEIIRDASGRPVIDTRPFLSREAYLSRDAHFNEHGNAIVARIIIDYLEENRLVK
jgi:hypothetical protein